MTPTADSLQSRLLEATVLLDKFRSGIATDRDHEEAKRILLEGRQDDTWIEESQLFPLSCLIVEALGGKLAGAEGTSRRHYTMIRQGTFRRRDLILIVDQKQCGSVWVQGYESKGSGPNLPLGRHNVTTYDRVSSLKGLIPWLNNL